MEGGASTSEADALQRVGEHCLMTMFRKLLDRTPVWDAKSDITHLINRGLYAVDVVNVCLGAPTTVDIAVQHERSDIAKLLRKYNLSSSRGHYYRHASRDPVRATRIAMIAAIECRDSDTSHQLVEQILAVCTDPAQLFKDTITPRSSPLILAIIEGRDQIARSLFGAGARTRVCGDECKSSHRRCAVSLIGFARTNIMSLYIIAHLDQHKCIGKVEPPNFCSFAGRDPIYDCDRVHYVQIYDILPIVAAAMLRLTSVVRRWLREVPITESMLDQLDVAVHNELRGHDNVPVAPKIEDAHELHQLYLSLRAAMEPTTP